MLIEEARALGRLPVLESGVYFQQRGPRLDTRAEVAFMGTLADCVGMTVGSEATVARELGLALRGAVHPRQLRQRRSRSGVDQGGHPGQRQPQRRGGARGARAGAGQVGGVSTLLIRDMRVVDARQDRTG